MAIQVYNGGLRRHGSEGGPTGQLHEIRRGERTVISDAVAQTIAAWWHSPRKGNTTLLSGQGIVMSDTDIADFADPEEYDNCDEFERLCLDMLRNYIETKKREYLSRNPMLCSCCFELAVKDFNKNPGTRKQSAWQGDVQRVECEKCYEPLIRWWSDTRGWSGWDHDYSSL